MGSGKYLWNAINKYGIENFSKEIIYIAKTEQEALDYEKYIIEHYYLYLDKNYYISTGGTGGNSLAGYTKDDLKKYKENQSNMLKNFYSVNKHHMIGKKLSDDFQAKKLL